MFCWSLKEASQGSQVGGGGGHGEDKYVCERI